MASPIGVAFIGAGLFVKDEYLPAVLANPLLSLRAIYSRTRASAESVAALVPAGVPAPDLYSDDSGPGQGLLDLLARADVAAVIVAVAIAQIARNVDQALAAGKHVLSEKPIAHDVAAARRLVAAHRARLAGGGGPTWAVAENYRITRGNVHARREVEKLGQVTGFCYRFYNMDRDNQYFQVPWRVTPEHQGGLVLDIGVHLIASIRHLIAPDKLDSVMALTSQVVPEIRPFDSLSAVLKTRSGVVGTISFSVGQTLRPIQLELACERGSVAVTGIEGSCANGHFVSVTRPKDGGGGAGRAFETETSEFTESTFKIADEVAAWADGLHRGVQLPAFRPEEALADLEGMEMMFRSAEQGGAAQKLQLQDVAVPEAEAAGP